MQGGGPRYLNSCALYRISSLDVALAARILLLTKPIYPDATIKDLITTSYQSLVAHAHHVQERILGSGTLPLKIESQSLSLWSVFPSAPFNSRAFSSRRVSGKTDEERHMDRMRWGFVGLVVGVVCAYVAVLAPSRLALADQIRQGGWHTADENDLEEEHNDDEYEEEILDFVEQRL